MRGMMLQRQLFVGILFGFGISFLLTSQIYVQHTVRTYIQTSSLSDRICNGDNVNPPVTAVLKDPHTYDTGINGHIHDHEDLDNSTTSSAGRVVEFNDKHVHHDDDSMARALHSKVRVLCWVMTAPSNLDKKAIHVKKTWGHRCNILLFFSSVSNATFPTIGLNISEGRQHLTGKTMMAFRYLYENHLHDADWFMKADDDTYVIVENLRYFLSSHSPDEPVYFGHHFKTIVPQGYFSGGAGYVLSKEALKRLNVNGTDPKVCRKDGGAEDAEMGWCMQRLGIKTGTSVDKLGRSRFHCFDPATHLHGSYPDWYLKYDAHGAKKGTENISDYAVSFHYINWKTMYMLEFYIYHLRPYGIAFGHQDIN